MESAYTGSGGTAVFRWGDSVPTGSALRGRRRFLGRGEALGPARETVPPGGGAHPNLCASLAASAQETTTTCMNSRRRWQAWNRRRGEVSSRQGRVASEPCVTSPQATSSPSSTGRECGSSLSKQYPSATTTTWEQPPDSPTGRTTSTRWRRSVVRHERSHRQLPLRRRHADPA